MRPLPSMKQVSSDLTDQQAKMNNSRGKKLLELARAAIAGQLDLPWPSVDSSDGWLQEKAATFVTLTKHGQLRGCIGSLEARRSLLEDVTENAKSAAFRDPRFSPLTADEFDDIEIEVSLLSPSQAMTFSSETEALTQLQPGVDGIVFEYGPYRSTFLPQVWEQLPKPADFMANLKMKAGLPADFWHDDVRLKRYHVSKWRERDFRSQDFKGESA